MEVTDRTKSDLLDYLVRKEIGRGAFRTVYQHALDPSLVIKIEEIAGDFSNVEEWTTWEVVQSNKKWKKWFAPCVYLSGGSNVLIQKKTAPIRLKSQLPKRMPSFFTDFKVTNYGIFNDHIVCHDYGLAWKLRDVGFNNAKLEPVEWWDLEDLDDGN